VVPGSKGREPRPEGQFEFLGRTAPFTVWRESIIGAGRITSKVAARSHHSPSFTYVVSSRQAVAVIAQVAPYLQTYESSRARLLLKEYASVTPRNGRYSPAQRAARQQFEDRFFAISVRAPSKRPEAPAMGGNHQLPLSLNRQDEARGRTPTDAREVANGA
jgi:hypothetical protein